MPASSARLREVDGARVDVTEIGDGAPRCRRAAGRAGTHARGSAAWPTVFDCRPGHVAPSCRARSSASTGPRKGRRPARGRTLRRRWPPRRRRRSSERSVRQPVAVDCLLEPGDAVVVVEIGDRSRSQIVGQFGRRVAQLSLFRGQSDVHSRSFSTRRSTLPDGRRGISSTNTTRLGRL